MKVEKAYFWPSWFYHDLTAEKPAISRSTMSLLGKANLDLWKALNIYDDFLDNDGRPGDLPDGNRSYRYFLEAYYSLHLPHSFYIRFHKILDELDRYNRYETRRCRAAIIGGGQAGYPTRLPAWRDIRRLADKSLALALGPIALLHISRLANEPKRVEAALDFFRLALSAKQLADDSGDWQEDLEKGRLTPANALVIKAARKRKLILDLKSDPRTAHLLFAAEASGPIARQISGLCRQARTAAIRAELRPDGRLISNLIEPLELAVEKAEEFRRILANGSIKML
jgi:hypothetical protein